MLSDADEALLAAAYYAPDALARTLIVETSSTEQYASTRAFYASRGFAEEARIRQFYGPTDDKVVAWLTPIDQRQVRGRKRTTPQHCGGMHSVRGLGFVRPSLHAADRIHPPRRSLILRTPSRRDEIPTLGSAVSVA
ncbi:MAG: hypothetical protein ACE37F_22405 [Nannocystaceae bacterium]|nr:hypothetical protein [bacterium]